MKRMEIDRLQPLTIGRQLDGQVETVMIDCRRWQVAHPALTQYRVQVTAPTGEVYLPTQVVMQDGVLLWHITQADTAAAGCGAYEVVATGTDGERKTSAHQRLMIHDVMAGTADDTPPSPSQPWVDAVLAAAQRAEAAAERAEQGGSGGGSASPGVSPTVGVSKTGRVTTVTITDAEGTKTAEILDGEDGEPGYTPVKGVDYSDGISPTISASKNGKVTTLTITDADGTKTTTINDGTDGKTPVKGTDYFDGAKGDPGVSPTIAASKNGKVTTLTITDADGTRTTTINDGADGKTPVKGTDYFTAAEQAAMVTQVKASLTSETWTFTLADGSTVNKAVLLG